MNILPKQVILARLGGISSTTLWRMCREDKFPKPVTVSGNRVGWIDAQVDEWFAAKAGKLAA